jgi:hypothetical protein
MKNRTASIPKNIYVKINQIVEETDIRILVYAPPIIGFIGLLIGILILNLFTKGQPFQPITDIMLEVLFLIPCFSGYAEIYKKEMPGLFGGIYRGNLAVISGVFIIILSVLFSALALTRGIGALFGVAL